MTPEALRGAGYRGSLESNRSLAAWTTWRIGGPAAWVASPERIEDLTQLLRWAEERNLRVRILGNGSNLLVADRGLAGLVVRMRKVFDDVEHAADGSLIVGAGASLPALARYAARRGLAGLEFATGIPGTVGGALTMNAGWHEYETGPLVRWVDAVSPQGERRRFAGGECAFRYRHSRFLDEHWVLVAACFELPPGEPKQIRERLDGFAASRKAHQPTSLPSCGSVFVQPPGDYAGRLIDAAGLKGEREGGIEVSTLHANFFVNRGGGTAADVLRLVERVERTVLERFGVALTREFEYWSDDEPAGLAHNPRKMHRTSGAEH